ncbi:MAG: hypothetical protein HC777_04035 [Hyphomonadaceae bacterium]|nr:hypothetical protein [Hyphomonadaceae bacterium]
MAQSSIPGNVKSGLRNVIEDARSSSFIGAPSIQVRIEAGVTFLRSEGYYGAQIDVREPDIDPPTSDGDGFELELPNDSRRLFVRAGPRFVIQSTSIKIDGPDLTEARAVRDTILEDLRVLDDQPARAGDVLRAQNQALQTLKEAGFTQAEDRYPDIVVDHATSGMQIDYAVTTGPLTKLGSLSVVGANLTPSAWVIKAAGIRPGSVASGERLRQLSERFRLTGAYQSVDLALQTPVLTTPETATANLMLTLEERTKRTWSAGAEWSTSDGLGLDASTSFFHHLARADTLTLDGRVGTLESSLGASLRLPSLRGAGRDLSLVARAASKAQMLSHV